MDLRQTVELLHLLRKGAHRPRRPQTEDIIRRPGFLHMIFEVRRRISGDRHRIFAVVKWNQGFRTIIGITAGPEGVLLHPLETNTLETQEHQLEITYRGPQWV